MKLKISEIKSNESNPRVIRDKKFEKLVQSIKDFPEMLDLRPIVIDEDNIILGGNMRYRACIEAGMKEVPVKIAKGLSQDQKKEFIVKDNLAFGEWDWDIIGNEWNNVKLGEWGMDVWQPEEIDFNPSLEPETKYSDITKEEIEKKAKELANAMIKEGNNVEVMCPECQAEFQVQVG
tara:strand:- start:503 stop:1033 length:531 start_codon:yes stop_codon:yes gene_type:complete